MVFLLHSAFLIPEHPRTVFVVVRTYVTSLWERKDDAKLSNKNVGVVRSDAPSYTPDHITRGVQPRTRQLCGCKQRHHLLSLIFRKVTLIQRRRVTDWVWDSNIICTREYLPRKMPCCEDWWVTDWVRDEMKLNFVIVTQYTSNIIFLLFHPPPQLFNHLSLSLFSLAQEWGLESVRRSVTLPKHV